MLRVPHYSKILAAVPQWGEIMSLEDLKRELEQLKKERLEKEYEISLKNEIKQEKSKLFDAKNPNITKTVDGFGKGLGMLGKGLFKVVDNLTKPVDGNKKKIKSEWKLPEQEDINKII